MRINISVSKSSSDDLYIRGGLYSSVKPIGTAITKLKTLLSSVQHIQPHYDDLHCTVLYSKNKAGVMGTPRSERVYAANIKEFTHWVGHNGKTYLVALLDSHTLQKAFRDWEAMGYSSDYPDYKPHITIKKDISKEEAQRCADILTIEYFKNPFILTFGAQEIAPLEP